MSTELSAFVSAETDGQTSDSDSDDLGESSGDEFRRAARLRFGDEEEDQQAGKKGGKFSWLIPKLNFGSNRDRYRPLSVQSGDIVHSSTVPSSSTYTYPRTAAGVNVVPIPSTTTIVVPPAATVSIVAHQDTTDPITEREIAAKGGLYAAAFPAVHAAVKVLFYHERFSLVPIGWLVLHFILTVVLVVLALFIYPPSLNLTIEAFSIPNHPSQIHWDAFTAAKDGKIWNDSVSNNDPSGSDVVYDPQQPLGKNILKRNIIEGCDRDPSKHYQTRLHVVWELDLVFRVPESNPDPSKNILTEERIRRIHDIEEHIYNLPDYKDFCHKGLRANFCDPINSLLTWLYPRHKENGSFVYNPDHLTHNLTDALLQLKNNHTNALWFTGGQVTVINSTNFVAKLLRSQVRIGLPLPCFTFTGDRVKDHYNDEYHLVTKFFVSLIPFLEEASNGEVEVLYGGPNVFDYQVKYASMHDIILAAISLGLVLLLAFIMSGFSVWLMFVVFYTIGSSFPIAFFVYTKIFGINTFGLLNVISFFVIIGIGVDDILVFINTFKQSSRLAGLNTVHKRIAHTIIEASKATFFTSITTSVAFFANAISSIPAVYQFGLFMGLIVIFCYVQVVLVIPSALHIWYSYFLIIENCVFSPCARLCRQKDNSEDLPAVRMTHRSMEDGDSGIEIMENGNGSREQSDNSSTASSSSVSDTNVLIPESEVKDSEMKVEPTSEIIEEEPQFMQSSHFDGHNEDNSPLLLPTRMEVTITETRVIEDPSMTNTVPSGNKASAESRWTELQQIGMIRFVAYPIMFWFLVGVKFSSKHKARLCSLAMVLGFIIVLLTSYAATAFLKPTDRPPQFFKPGSNIQKMLDLSGNLTSADAVNCYSCSAWYTPGAIPTANPPPVAPSNSPSHSPPPSSPSSPPTSHSSATTARTEPPSHPQPPSTTLPPFNPHTQPPHTNPPPPQQHTTQPSNPHSHTDSPPKSNPDSHTTASPTKRPPTAPPNPVTNSPPAPTGPGTNETVVSNQFSNNAVVYVVFGIDGVHRRYDASHVIPEEGEGDFAVLNANFNSTFSCPLSPGSQTLITGSIRAMCRICLNISNPDNGLVLKGNFQCFSRALVNDLGCLINIAQGVKECLPLINAFTSSSKAVTVKAEHGIHKDTDGTITLQYLAMAFRSTSNPGESPFSSMTEYQRWEDFLAKELKEISNDQSLYSKAGDLLSSTFQTGDYWVQVNLELVAVYGSIYGILISFSLCSLVVAVLSHNWRIVLSMFLTIKAILFSLLGLFSIFGWKLGIVEAVSLSILVGNALDYCIHLSEGYMAVDNRHLAFVERFKFTAGASLRVKRVMASISFIGVSIISSAITTIVAIIPLLGTWIQLFTRFGAILLIETLVAIIFTLVFCSTFLALFGPLKTTLKYRIANALGTILGTIGFYLIGLLGVYIATRSGVVIPGPDGSPLFS